MGFWNESGEAARSWMRTALRRELHLAVRVGEVAARCDGPGELVPERVGRSGHGRESEQAPTRAVFVVRSRGGAGPAGCWSPGQLVPSSLCDTSMRSPEHGPPYAGPAASRSGHPRACPSRCTVVSINGSHFGARRLPAMVEAVRSGQVHLTGHVRGRAGAALRRDWSAGIRSRRRIRAHAPARCRRDPAPLPRAQPACGGAGLRTGLHGTSTCATPGLLEREGERFVGIGSSPGVADPTGCRDQRRWYAVRRRG